jgi:uncharacterized membrane protein
MNRAAGSDSIDRGRRPPRRLIRAQRRLRAELVQLLFASTGLVLGLVLPRLRGGPTVNAGRLTEPLFTLGLGVVGVVAIVFSLLFGVVQWSASAFSPRLNLFRDDPLVWRTFAVTIGVFVFCVSAGLSSGNAGQISVVVPITAIVGVLVAFGLIRALQVRAFLSLQLSQVLAGVAARGRTVISELFPHPYDEALHAAPAVASPPPASHTVSWAGPTGVVQQFDLRRLLEAAGDADALVVLRVGVGDTLYEGTHIADIHRGDLEDRVVRAAVVLGAERSFAQDPMLALRLLADIALRALSPAVNDPATAVDALDATEGLLRILAVRELRVADLVDDKHVPRIRLELPTWEDYLRTAVEDLLPVAANIPMVLDRLQRLLTALLELSPPARPDALTRLGAEVGVLRAARRPAAEVPRPG